MARITAFVVGAIAIMPIAGFFVTGTSAEMPLNMPGRAFLDHGIPLNRVAIVVQEGLVASDWVNEHTRGFDEIGVERRLRADDDRFVRLAGHGVSVVL